MTTQNKTTLKGYFNTGDKPTESNFADLIDSSVGETFNSVADNTTKLALSGIDPGYTVRVTGEANRIEKYIGGDASTESSWLTYFKTVEVIADRSGDDLYGAVTVGGVSAVTGTTTNLGWFKVGEEIEIVMDDYFANAPTILELNGETHGQIISIILSGGGSYPVMGWQVAKQSGDLFIIPDTIPNRSSVTIDFSTSGGG